MTGSPQIGGHRGGIDRDVNRGGAIARRDPRRHSESASRVDADRESGGQLFGVSLGHLREPELVAALPGERQTDQASPVERHEVDHLRRDQLGRADKIAFILPVFVIGHDDDLPVPKVFDRLLNSPEGGHV